MHGLRAVAANVLLMSATLAAAADIDLGHSLAFVTPRESADLKSIPTDREMRARGTRIGHVQIVVDDVFEQALSLSTPYRMVNALHMSTHRETVRQQLLFREGDRFDRRVLAETERGLREQRYLSDASVQPVGYNDDNTVDVLVHVHDVWTMSPGISFGRKGGENSMKFEFEDTNFLGLGKTLAIERAANVDRSAWRLGYVDPHVLGSWWRLSAEHAVLSDGSADAFAIGRPFYSLDSKWSAQLSAAETDATTPRYSLGKEVDRFGSDVRTLAFDGGISRGLIDGWTTRYLFGVRYEAREFDALPSQFGAYVPRDQTYAYPYVGVQWIEDGFIATRNLNQIGRTEDLHLGRSLTATVGLATSALGSTNTALMLSTQGESGFEFGDERFLIGDFAFLSRLEDNGLRNASLNAGARYFQRQSGHRVFFAGLNAAVSSHLDDDMQLLLGGDNGLRGYPLRYQAGTSRAVLTLEQRFYTDWQPLKLANVGAAVFADAGRMWGRDAFAAAPAGWLSDVGIGLRLGSARSGLGNILHIDIAFPLQRTNDIDAVQFLVETKKSF